MTDDERYQKLLRRERRKLAVTEWLPIVTVTNAWHRLWHRWWDRA